MNSTAAAVSARRSHHPANGDPGVRVGDREREKVVTRLSRRHELVHRESVPQIRTWEFRR